MADGEALILGRQNEANNATRLRAGTLDEAALSVESGPSGRGIAASGGENGLQGVSAGGIGVEGTSTAGIGVFGSSTSSNAVAAVSKTGVAAIAVSDATIAVLGASTDGVWSAAGVSDPEARARAR